MTSPPNWYSTKDVSRLTGLTPRQVLERMKPEHADYIPNYPHYGPKGKRKHYKIPADQFHEWQERRAQ